MSTRLVWAAGPYTTLGAALLLKNLWCYGLRKHEFVKGMEGTALKQVMFLFATSCHAAATGIPLPPIRLHGGASCSSTCVTRAFTMIEVLELHYRSSHTPSSLREMYYLHCISSLEPSRNVSKVTSDRHRSRRQGLTLKQGTKSTPASRSSLPDSIMSQLLPGEIFMTMCGIPSFRLERVSTNLSETWYQLWTGWPGLFLANCWRHENVSHSVMSDSLWPHGLLPTRLLCPWDSPGKNTGVGCHSLLQRIFPTQGLNPGLLTAGRFFTIWTTVVWSKWVWLQNSQKVSSSPPLNHPYGHSLRIGFHLTAWKKVLLTTKRAWWPCSKDSGP